LTGNVMLENGIVISGETPSDYSNEIDESNTVNGKPVYYWKNIQGGKIPDGAGQVILVNCTNVVVENQNLNNASIGLQLAYSSSITIKNNNCSNNRYGIYLRDSENNSISNNICSNNGDGIYLGDSENNSISNNICSNNRYGFGIFLLYSKNNSITNNICSNNRWNGIILGDSKNNRITNNICSNNGCGIYLRDSKNNCITNNTCSNNEGGDICLAYSKNNKLTGNVMLENGIVIVKFSSYNSLSDYTHEIDESNTVNGKPVYYWKDKEGGKIPDGAGQVILVNCMNVIVENQNLNNASTGIVLAYSSSITIKNNICSNNRWNGIDLEYSKNNRIYLNDFVNNTDNVHSYYSNTWNSPETITYTYNGSTYAKYLGNYWDDYTGNDTNNDGIGDTPYYMHPGIDNYPLMHPWENYFVKENGTMNKNETHQFAFSSYYQPINSSVNLSVPPYPLPLNLSNVTNIENITAKLKLSERGKELLKNNGFVIIDYGRFIYTTSNSTRFSKASRSENSLMSLLT
jgi:parallel beta-helix repeat protein